MQTNIEKSIIETVEFLFVFDSNNLINLCKSFNVDTLNIKADIDKLTDNEKVAFNKLLLNYLPEERNYSDD